MGGRQIGGNMKLDQIIRLLKVGIVTTIILLVFEVIFSLDVINNFFLELISGANGWLAYLFVWLIMFLQVTVLNIPAYSVLAACTSIGMHTLDIVFISVVLSAYMAGAILAYWFGRWFGKRAVKWCAGSEDDYNKWSNVLNSKGKWWYFATIVFPFFPDDLLCIVAGAVKFHFGLYTIMNFVGRGIGLITIILTLKLITKVSGGFPFMIIVWAVALLAEVITYIILLKRSKKNGSNAGDTTTTENTELDKK